MICCQVFEERPSAAELIFSLLLRRLGSPSPRRQREMWPASLFLEALPSSRLFSDSLAEVTQVVRVHVCACVCVVFTL